MKERLVKWNVLAWEAESASDELQCMDVPEGEMSCWRLAPEIVRAWA